QLFAKGRFEEAPTPSPTCHFRGARASFRAAVESGSRYDPPRVRTWKHTRHNLGEFKVRRALRAGPDIITGPARSIEISKNARRCRLRRADRWRFPLALSHSG